MYDFDSCFDLPSDATSAVQNAKKKLHKKNILRSSLTLKCELDKLSCLLHKQREADLLKWWKTNRSIISELGNVVNKMLCSPPFSVEIERLFSRSSISTTRN